ncbi:uncharacterized protein LOC124926460 [Impatiens glandulifera]|uniref:uncharacterized protein LOC124926460 n=1 Tax=Impatiens glandulifera TaxID=253017 RepID=UPI001FB0ED82|nr:uncharacterized protein LOC124926460 [Impatiens glandulifera]
MGKKRKSVATSLDEIDRTMYSAFCSAANSLSQLYTQAMHQQKLTFQAGERHGLEKLYQWILRHQEGGSRLNTIDILGYLQAELDYHGEEPSMSPRAPLHNQNPQPTMNIANPSSLVSSGSSGDQQPKSCVFSNALSSPVRRSLQNYHISRGGGNSYNNIPPQPLSVVAPNGFRNTESNFLQEQNRDPNPCNSNDSFMDMHVESPSHDSTY